MVFSKFSNIQKLAPLQGDLEHHRETPALFCLLEESASLYQPQKETRKIGQSYQASD